MSRMELRRNARQKFRPDYVALDNLQVFEDIEHEELHMLIQAGCQFPCSIDYDTTPSQQGSIMQLLMLESTPESKLKDDDLYVEKPQKKKQKKKLPPQKTIIKKRKRKDNATSHHLSAKERNYSKTCAVCHDGGMIWLCDGGCQRSFHYECMRNNVHFCDEDLPMLDEDGRWECPDCRKNVGLCGICGCKGSRGRDVFKCKIGSCASCYHIHCLTQVSHQYKMSWHNGQVSAHFTCPRHYCRACHCSGDAIRLFRCWSCINSYHDKCIPSGSISHQLMDQQLTCPTCLKAKKEGLNLAAIQHISDTQLLHTNDMQSQPQPTLQNLLTDIEKRPPMMLDIIQQSQPQKRRKLPTPITPCKKHKLDLENNINMNNNVQIGPLICSNTNGYVDGLSVKSESAIVEDIMRYKRVEDEDVEMNGSSSGESGPFSLLVTRMGKQGVRKEGKMLQYADRKTVYWMGKLPENSRNNPVSFIVPACGQAQHTMLELKEMEGSQRWVVKYMVARGGREAPLLNNRPLQAPSKDENTQYNTAYVIQDGDILKICDVTFHLQLISDCVPHINGFLPHKDVVQYRQCTDTSWNYHDKLQQDSVSDVIQQEESISTIQQVEQVFDEMWNTYGLGSTSGTLYSKPYFQSFLSNLQTDHMTVGSLKTQLHKLFGLLKVVATIEQDLSVRMTEEEQQLADILIDLQNQPTNIIF